jgi:hypothetical protein
MMERQIVFGEDQSIAERNKENGMHSAVAHADREVDGWSDRAYEILKTFLIRCSLFDEFMGEDIREYAKRLGFPDPPSERAWGAVIRRAAIKNLIKFVGYAKTTNPKAHRTPAALWKKASI